MTDATHTRVCLLAVERRSRIGGAQVGMRNDAVGKAVGVPDRLSPCDFLELIAGSDVHLHENRLHDAVWLRVRPVIVDRIVAANGAVFAEDARLHRAREPRHAGGAPDVVMRVDDGFVQRCHALRIRLRF